MEHITKQIGKIPGKNELEKSLEKREIPLKFCYLEEGAKKWKALRKNEDYKLGKGELKNLHKALPKVRKIIGNISFNLIHLGPGNGIEIPFFFKEFELRNNGKYVGVDISQAMIYSASKKNESLFSNNSLWYLTDIESKGNLKLVCEDVKNKGENRNLIIASNEGTLFSNLEMLSLIKDSMTSQDYFFVNLERDSPEKRKEICDTYDLLEIRNLLSINLKKAGYNSKNGKFRTSFNEKKSQVEVYFKPTNEEKILCLTSYKPRKNELQERLIKNGLQIEFLDYYQETNSFAVLCTKGRKNV